LSDNKEQKGNKAQKRSNSNRSWWRKTPNRPTVIIAKSARQVCVCECVGGRVGGAVWC